MLLFCNLCLIHQFMNNDFYVLFNDHSLEIKFLFRLWGGSNKYLWGQRCGSVVRHMPCMKKPWVLYSELQEKKKKDLQWNWLPLGAYDLFEGALVSARMNLPVAIRLLSRGLESFVLQDTISLVLILYYCKWKVWERRSVDLKLSQKNLVLVVAKEMMKAEGVVCQGTEVIGTDTPGINRDSPKAGRHIDCV